MRERKHLLRIEIREGVIRIGSDRNVDVHEFVARSQRVRVALEPSRGCNSIFCSRRIRFIDVLYQLEAREDFAP